MKEFSFAQIPSGYILISNGETIPQGWKHVPEYEVGNFPEAEIGPARNLTWDEVHALNPHVKLIMKE